LFCRAVVLRMTANVNAMDASDAVMLTIIFYKRPLGRSYLISPKDPPSPLKGREGMVSPPYGICMSVTTPVLAD